MMTADIGWTALRWPGMEHVIVSEGADGMTAASHAVLAENRLVTLAYDLTCDASFRFRKLTMSVADAGGEQTLTLLSSDGDWLADGTSRPDLAGCVDIDINCTPLTNTLPVRRLDWSAEATHDIEVAYVTVPELNVRKVSQRYTRLSPTLFRYESGSFRRDLTVDESGFVLDYPGLWRRLSAEAGR
jgi:uncharacterized protein